MVYELGSVVIAWNLTYEDRYHHHPQSFLPIFDLNRFLDYLHPKIPSSRTYNQLSLPFPSREMRSKYLLLNQLFDLQNLAELIMLKKS